MWQVGYVAQLIEKQGKFEWLGVICSIQSTYMLLTYFLKSYKYTYTNIVYYPDPKYIYFIILKAFSIKSFASSS